MALWSTQELTAIGKLVPETAKKELTGVSIDSRQIQPGDLFIALSGDPGPRFHGGVENPRDGHDFISAAVNNGAAAVLLSVPQAGSKVPYIQVDDTLDGLWDLAKLARNRSEAAVVAITGSAGKTTAKSWLSECLQAQADVHSSVGSLNNHWGVPLTLSRMPKQSQVGIIEIGTNHPGEIGPLSELARPNVAVLLNVLPAHIGNFPSLSALTIEKRSIAAGLEPGGKLVLPTALASGAANEVTFGFEPDADVSGAFEIEQGVYQVRATVRGKAIEYQLKEGGEHRVLTTLAVLAVVHCLGYRIEDAAICLAGLSSPVGRGNSTTVQGVHVIDDSYNANPVSMIHAIDSLAQRDGRRIALLGEILELGEEAERYHKDVSCKFDSLDEVITFGVGFQKHQGAQHFDTVDQFDLEQFVASLSKGDQILIKGSNKVFWQKGFVHKLISALGS